MSIEAMKQALEALEDVQEAYGNHSKWFKDRVDALRQAIEQAEKQEPVAWANPHDLQNFDMKVRTNGGPLHTVPLYTAPPPRQPLTDEEIETIANDFEEGYVFLYRSFARAIEAKLKEKNTWLWV